MDKKETAKERILRVASDLFYREGIRAVGIDRIIAESGVAKASFYRNFATKDDLIVAYLDSRESFNTIGLEEAAKRYPDSPIDQLLFLVDDFAARLQAEGFRGCPFINTIVEFPDEDHPGHRKALESRNERWRKVTDIARQAGARDPEELTAQLRMLSSGATIGAYMLKSAFRTESYVKAARLLIEHQLTNS
ncbi:TetR/AcrR family transcriptional regulator [Paenibacillus hamazuiensis]|uniref:TetR/AcrR family transcriptional regulator n=1 Tax=Paenibacillus hamazuiensis TaxID=2936508 RepID=UPI00200E9AAB|nr:TetR/AcrR family transcriptional regulator [Paenibacillus hamazuiensis]